MMLYPRNVLALDEPTNHLDIPAREVLEEALESYEGSIIVVSHDRYFIDRVCGRLLVFENDTLEAHLGNYSDWRSRRERATASRPVAKAAPEPARRITPTKAPAVVAAPPPPRSSSPRADRERQRVERRLASVREELERLQAEVGTVRAELAGDHGGNWQKLHELAAREQSLGELIARREQDVVAATAALARLSHPQK
jgi:ATP-binding cassette subfamily F protein 3